MEILRTKDLGYLPQNCIPISAADRNGVHVRSIDSFHILINLDESSKSRYWELQTLLAESSQDPLVVSFTLLFGSPNPCRWEPPKIVGNPKILQLGATVGSSKSIFVGATRPRLELTSQLPRKNAGLLPSSSLSLRGSKDQLSIRILLPTTHNFWKPLHFRL